MDLSSLLGDTEPTDDEQRAAQIAALRGKSTVATAGPTPMGLPQMDPDSMEAMGLLGQLTGDRVLSPVGSSVLAQAHQRRQLDEQRQEKSLTRALAARKEAQQEAYQKEEADASKARIEIERQRASQDAWGQPIVTAQGTFMRNGHNGQVKQVLGPDGAQYTKPAPGGAGGDKETEKELGALLADLDPARGRNGAFGKDYTVTQGADKLRRLTQGGYNLYPQQVTELSTALANLISGGSGAAQSQIEHLTPHTLGGDAAKVAQWVTGNPTGAEQQAFVKAMMETAEREDQGAKERIKTVQLQRLPRHVGVFTRHPEQAAPLAHGFLSDLSSEELASAFSGRYAPKAAGGAQAPAGATATPQLQPGEVLMFDLKGKPHAVPQSKVDDAVLHKWRRG